MLNIRKINVIERTYRHLNRYRQILSILFKFGFGDLIEQLGVDQYVEAGMQVFSRKKVDREEKLTRAQRVRLAIEELGPTYIKLGQILSTRPDLIPVDFISELSKLQDKVSPNDFQDLRSIIEDELGGRLETLFSRIDEAPLASASIGQVHVGQLVSGEEVAVKVQRPGIRKTVEVDLEIMMFFATLMERHIADIAFHRPVKIVEEFARILGREMDYTIEAASTMRFARNFSSDKSVYVPKVYTEFSTMRVLVMEFIDGIKVSHLDQIEAAGLNKQQITVRGAQLLLKQVFIHGFFHADPHPGNIFILPDNVICLLDFGMVASVDRHTRERFVELIDSVVHKDESRTTQALLELTSWKTPPDLRFLERDVADFIGIHFYKPLKELEFGRCMMDLIDVAVKHQLRISPDLFLMIKALATLEGVARRLDPEFDLIAQAKPFVAQVRMERFSPHRIARDMIGISGLLVRLGEQLPRDLLDIMRTLREQRVRFTVVHQGLQDMLSTHDQISNRISFSIVIAALIIGSALIVISKTPPFIFGISLIGIIGFLAAAVMGVWLLIAILKKGKL
jgi:ubiquinone biosynthesis protein